MTTLQEAQTMALIDAYADAVADYVASDYCMAGDNSNLGERAKEARAAVVAALAQQGKQQPVAYITQTEQGQMVWTPEMYDEACTYCDDGEFPVPLYTVTLRPTSGDYALGYAEGFNDACKPAPQAQPMTNPCKTCSHFQEGKLPGVRIHDETCYECRSYWGNKWEAA